MSKTQTRTAPTAHGSVEYETVTCDSCGTEIAKSEAYKFAIWESGDVETFVKDAHTTGWACEFCRDKPIQFPRVERLSGYMGAFYRAMLADPDVDSVLRISAILYIWVSAVFILSFILAAVGA